MTREEYYRKHHVCPVCGSGKYSTTYVAYIAVKDHYENYKDLNSAVCGGCGWKGAVHDLVETALDGKTAIAVVKSLLDGSVRGSEVLLRMVDSGTVPDDQTELLNLVVVKAADLAVSRAIDHKNSGEVNGN